MEMIHSFSNTYHGGALDDGDGLDRLLLVKLRPGAIDVTNDVCHTGLEAHEGGQVRRKRSIILGERSDAT